MVVQEYTYAYAAVSVADGQLDTLILPRVNSQCMQVFLDESGSSWCSMAPVGIGATPFRWHPMCACLNCRRTRLNSIQSSTSGMTCGRNPSTESLDALENHLEGALHELELDHQRVHSIVAWPWIIASL